MTVRSPVFEKRKTEMVKIELHVPRATYGNYEKLRQALKYEDVQTTILRVMQQKIRRTLGHHYVPVPKRVYGLLQSKAQQKGMDFQDFVSDLLNALLKEDEAK